MTTKTLFIATALVLAISPIVAVASITPRTVTNPASNSPVSSSIMRGELQALENEIGWISNAVWLGTGSTTPTGLLMGNGTTQLQSVTLGTNLSLSGSTLNVSSAPVYNVLVYGAKFDNSTDDTASIQSAIDAANSAGGGVISMPSGYSKLTSLTLYSNVMLGGTGTSTVLVTTDSTKTAALYSSSAISHVTLANFRIQGPGENASGIISGVKIGDISSASSFVHIDNVEVDDFPYYGIYLNTPIASELGQTKVKNVGFDGFYLYNGTSITFHDTYGTGANRANYDLDTMAYVTLNSTASEYSTYQYWVQGGENIVFNGTGSEQAFLASSTLSIVAQYRVDNASNVIFNGTYSKGFFSLGSASAYHYYIDGSQVDMNFVFGTASLGGADVDVAPTGTVFIDSASLVTGEYPHFSGQIGSGQLGVFKVETDANGKFALNASTSASQGRLELNQSTDTVNDGIGVRNKAQNASLRIWVDANGFSRYSAGPSENGSILFNGDGTGKFSMGSSSPSAFFTIQSNPVASEPAIIFNIASSTGLATTTLFVVTNSGNTGVGTTTPRANFQVTTTSANATTSVQFGKPGQNKGTCSTIAYDTAGSPIYMYFAAGATTPTYQNGGTAPSGCIN